MLVNLLSVAFILSVDSLGVGITYGIRNIKISIKSKLVLLIISFIITLLSTSIGFILLTILPDWLPNMLGCIILLCMGFFIIIQSFKRQSGITEILRDPAMSDLDSSQTIDSKEALILGLAMSVDSLVCGIGYSIAYNFSFIFPFLVSIFQLIFLSIGIILGKKINSISSLSPAIWSRISGILLIFLGIIKLL